MTPREINWRIKEDRERENREFERLAQLACWVINPSMPPKGKLTVSKLLTRKGGKQKPTNWTEWAK